MGDIARGDYDPDAFQSLEDTHQISVETAHRNIVWLAREPFLNEAGAKQLLIFTRIIEDARKLEIQDWIARQKHAPQDPAEISKE